MTELPDIVAGAVDHARGDEEVEAYAVHCISTTIQAGTDAAIRHVSRAETRGVGVRVIRDARLGYASSSDLSPEVVRATVERARMNADASDRDEAQALPSDGPLEPAAEQPNNMLVDAPLDDKLALVIEVARRVVALDARVRALDTVEYHDEQKTVAIASTRDVHTVDQAGYVEIWADALGEDSSGRAGDYAYWLGRSLELFEPEKLAAEAVDRTVRLLGPVSSRHLGIPVVLDRNVVADLLTAVGKGLSGGPVSSGRTPFAGSAGHKVAATCVNLADDGRSSASLAAAAFDDEGVPRRRTRLIDNGLMSGVLHSTVTARAVGDGARSTGNAWRTSHKSVPHAAASCLMLTPTGKLTEILSNLPEAVYIQQLSGSRAGINAVTGRIDVGGIGWLMRDGQPAGPVKTVPMSTSLSEFLGAIEAIADDAAQVPFTPAAASTVVCSGRLTEQPAGST